MPGGRYPWAVRAGGPLLGGGSFLTKLFEWNSEALSDLPAGSSYARASEAYVSTLMTTAAWFQNEETNEIPFAHVRRNRQLLINVDWVGGVPPTNWARIVATGTVTSSPAAAGPGANQLRIECSNQREIIQQSTIGNVKEGDRFILACFVEEVLDVTSSTKDAISFAGSGAAITNTPVKVGDLQAGRWMQASCVVTADSVGSIVASFGLVDAGNGTCDFTISSPIVMRGQNSGDAFCDWVNDTVTYTANVPGVRVFDETNLCSVDGTGLVTIAPGAPITGGGFLCEPAETNELPDSFDYTAWTAIGLQPLVDNGVVALGLRETQIEADTSNGQHRLLDTGTIGKAGAGYVIVSPGTGRYVIVRRGGAANDYACFDTTTVSVTEEGAGVSGSAIEDLGDNIYKCTVDTADTSNVYAVSISDTSTPGTADYAFLGAGETLLLYQSQYEVTGTGTILTTGSSGSRSAGVFDTGIVIAAEFGAVLDVTLPVLIGAGRTVTLLGSLTTPQAIIEVDENFNVIMNDGGTPTTVATVSGGARMKISYGRDATGRSASVNGAAVVTGDAPSAVHEGENFQLGGSASLNQSRSIHHLSTLYEQKPSDAQLPSLSVP